MGNRLFALDAHKSFLWTEKLAGNDSIDKGHRSHTIGTMVNPSGQTVSAQFKGKLMRKVITVLGEQVVLIASPVGGKSKKLQRK